MLAPVKIITEQILSGGINTQERALLAAGFLAGYKPPYPHYLPVTTNRTYSPDRPDGYSALGLPIYGRIVLGNNDEGFSNTYLDAQGVSQTYNTVVIDCALITVDYNQQVVRTNIQGRKGSIKEYISSGDNDVTITGIFASLADQAPYTFIDSMNRIFNASVAIPVTNQYLNKLGINYLVTMPGCQLPQVAGGYALQNFTIKAITDEPAQSIFP